MKSLQPFNCLSYVVNQNYKYPHLRCHILQKCHTSSCFGLQTRTFGCEFQPLVTANACLHPLPIINGLHFGEVERRMLEVGILPRRRVATHGHLGLVPPACRAVKQEIELTVGIQGCESCKDVDMKLALKTPCSTCTTTTTHGTHQLEIQKISSCTKIGHQTSRPRCSKTRTAYATLFDASIDSITSSCTCWLAKSK